MLSGCFGSVYFYPLVGDLLRMARNGRRPAFLVAWLKSSKMWSKKHCSLVAKTVTGAKGWTKLVFHSGGMQKSQSLPRIPGRAAFFWTQQLLSFPTKKQVPNVNISPRSAWSPWRMPSILPCDLAQQGQLAPFCLCHFFIVECGFNMV